MARHKVTFSELLRRHRLIKTCKTLWQFFTARARDTELAEVASSMTLTTLMSLVPLLAVSLAIFAAFPSFADTRHALESAILESFLPDQYSEQIVHYLKEFSSHASGLTTFGLIGLAVTALLLIDKFFVTLNRIFKVRTMRAWPQRALIYWALVTLGPLGIALSLTMTGRATALAFSGLDTGLIPWLYVFLQITLQTFGYAVLYKFVPNCHVPFTHALTGGTIVAVIGQIVKQVFEYYVTAGTLTSIYGAFVALPVLLLWFYIAWFLVFSGAVITATIPQLTSGRYSDSYRLGNDFVTGVAMLKVLTEKKLSAESPVMQTGDICDRVDSYPEAVNRILETLATTGYVAQIASDSRTDSQWALLCDPHTVNLTAAFNALAVNGGNTLLRTVQKDGQSGKGILSLWWQNVLTSDAISRPIAQTLIDKDPSP